MILERNRIVKIITIIINVGFCITLPISILAAIISPMMFDSPQSTESIVTWIAFYASITAPVVILVCVIASFILLFKVKKYNGALLLSLVPFINVVTFFSCMYFYSLAS